MAQVCLFALADRPVLRVGVKVCLAFGSIIPQREGGLEMEGLAAQTHRFLENVPQQVFSSTDPFVLVYWGGI